MMNDGKLLLTALTLISVTATATATANADPTGAAEPASLEITEQDSPEQDSPRPPRRRRHLRMSLEISAILAIGNRWYWRDNGLPNVEDWQLSHDMSAVETKLGTTDGWRFDGNPFDINALGHPGFGMLTHLLARRNGYSTLEAVLISTATSGTWEVFLELAEYGSINDMLATSPAGIPLGEAAYQILRNPRDTRFQLRSGIGVQNGENFGEIGVSGDLDRTPGSGDGIEHGSRKVGFDVGLASDAEGVRAVAGNARASLIGHYRNRADSTLYAGLMTAFDYRNEKDRENRPWDLQAKVEFGPTVDLQLRRSDVAVSLGADVRFGFAMLKSQAFDSWRAMHSTETVRNVMDDKARPYYYALGASVSPRLGVTYRDFHAGIAMSGNYFSSIDGQDRDQEILTADTHMTDYDARGQMWVGYRHGRVTAILNGDVTRRSGSMGDTSDQLDARTARLSVGYQL